MKLLVRSCWLIQLTLLACGATNEAAPAGRSMATGTGGISGTPIEGKAGAGETSARPASEQAGAGGTCWEMRPWSADGCGACELTLPQYCEQADCKPVVLPVCEGLPDAYGIDEGCGYLLLRMNGHADAIYAETVYDVQTRELVYYFDNGGRSSGCMPQLTVGKKPSCETWTTRCQGPGGA